MEGLGGAGLRIGRFSLAFVMAFTVTFAVTLVLAPQASALPSEAIRDSGFEDHWGRALVAPWEGEGPDAKGLDDDLGLQRSGRNNGWIRTSSRDVWNAITQRVTVQPNTNYRFYGWVRTSGNFNTGSFGVRTADTRQVLRQVSFGAAAANPASYQFVATPWFNTGSRTSLVVFAGFTSVGVDAWVQVDDLSLRSPYILWSGQVVTSSPRNTVPVTTVTATWTQPADHPCPPGAPFSYGIWVGIDGFENSSLMQLGTEVDCRGGNGRSRHYAWTEVIDDDNGVGTEEMPGYPVQAGDLITASVTVDVQNKALFYLSMQNHTRGWSMLRSRTSPHNTRQSAEVIVERPLGTARWPTSNIRVNVEKVRVGYEGLGLLWPGVPAFGWPPVWATNPMSAFDRTAVMAIREDGRAAFVPTVPGTNSDGDYFSVFNVTLPSSGLPFPLDP
ncbi:MAG: hypothetical protein HOV97_23180 [Nonomuraea sp.]|nr:hypothetical protein [Nonomuraea sp.]